MREPCRYVSRRVVLTGRFLTVLPLALLISSLNVHGQFMAMPLNCRTACVCASNIVSCSQMNLTSVPISLPSYTAVLDLSFNLISRLSADWTPVRLSRLHTLHLNHNGLTFLSSEAFVHVTQLRYLDLSSNGLRILEELIFEPLEHLQVLLLYNNHISQMDRTAFSGLFHLQKLYLSQNQISRFPVEVVKERGRLETLSLLDVSSNRIKALPLAELRALPAWIKNDLYVHRNPLPCSCDLYRTLALWDLHKFSSASDFREEHTCVMAGVKERVAVLDLDRLHLNCSEVKLVKENAYLGQYLVLDCDTRQRGMRKRWALPDNVTVSRADKSAVELPGGNLQIGPLKAEDSGVYLCHATGDAYNETLHITVEVFNVTLGGGLESIKTAYTTLVGCLASVIMVLIYLYLTPCPCARCPGHQGLTPVSGADDSLRSSTVSVCQMHEEAGGKQDGDKTDKNFLNRQQQQQQQHQTAFLGAKDLLEQNGRLNPIGEEEEEWQGVNGARRRSDAESVSSVCSGTPMVV